MSAKTLTGHSCTPYYADSSYNRVIEDFEHNNLQNHLELRAQSQRISDEKVASSVRTLPFLIAVRGHFACHQ